MGFVREVCHVAIGRVQKCSPHPVVKYRHKVVVYTKYILKDDHARKEWRPFLDVTLELGQLFFKSLVLHDIFMTWQMLIKRVREVKIF